MEANIVCYTGRRLVFDLVSHRHIQLGKSVSSTELGSELRQKLKKALRTDEAPDDDIIC